MTEKFDYESCEFSQLEKHLMSLRQYLTPGSNTTQQINSSLKQILMNLPQLHQKVHQYIVNISKDSLLKDQSKVAELKQNKLLLYYFQLLNLLLINLNQQQHSVSDLKINSLLSIIQHFVPIQKFIYQKTFKALLIFYFNLLKKTHHFLITQNNPLFLFQSLSNILKCYFASHFQQQNQKQLKFKQQTEWIGFIFQTLPHLKWNKINPSLFNSFLQNYFSILQSQTNKKLKLQSQYNMLHMLGNFLHLVIQSRTSTQLVKGYECPIQDVQKMYSNPKNTKICDLKLTIKDAQFICQLLIRYYQQEKNIFRQIMANKQSTLQKATKLPDDLVSTMSENQNQNFDKFFKKFNQNQQRNITTGQLILQTINILNCLLFLGGYSPSLQKLIFHKLFQNDLLPQFLQLAFLIYNQRRFMGKYSIKLTMAKPPDSNLSQILNINYQAFNNEEKKSIFKLIALQVKFGQLSMILRLMTNLIHINNQALTYFQNNLKYLYMVMSLTHQSQINLTMKNWAILFIKNSCDSVKLRQQINKVKIQMKVDQ